MMMSRVLCTVALISVAASVANTPSAQTPPTLEVASIKQNKSGDGRAGFELQGDRWTMRNMTIMGLLLLAYPNPNLSATDEASGAPRWVSSERYDVVAKVEGQPTPEQTQLMLRGLLAERFNFVAHYEKRERPVYGLVVARSDGRLAPQLRRLEIDCPTFRAERAGRIGGSPLSVAANGAPVCGYRMSDGRITSGGSTMAVLGKLISGLVDRAVLDRTGLVGDYEFTVQLSTQDDGPSVFTLLEEQLGLKLEPQRASLDELVVDRIERPTAD